MVSREITLRSSKGNFALFKKQAYDKASYDFSDISAIRKVLSNEKARILNVIKNKKPSSIYELAKKLNRTFKSVYQDVKLLERFGFIELIEEKNKNRARHRPKVLTDSITITIKL
jgi:predicted transcriptional regulator